MTTPKFTFPRMPENTVRIKDIAIEAGVSTGTVDRVLHNRGRVSLKVKKNVLSIIERLNYQPNFIARALGSNRRYEIAALIPDTKVDPYWEFPQSGIIKASEDLKQYGIFVKRFIFDPYNVDSFLQKAKEVSFDQPDGILIAPIFHREALPLLQKWKERQIPLVFFNTQLSDFDPLSYIGQDSYQSGLLAAKLCHYGQPQPCSFLIAHIDEDISNSAHLIKKEQGFFNYFEDNKLTNYQVYRAELTRSSPTFESDLTNLIKSYPNLRCIFITSSKAYAIAAYLEKHKIKNINVIGYDLIEKNIDFLKKGNISFLINQNPKGQGYWGIQALSDHLALKKKVSPIKYLPLDIITKENYSYSLDI
jgi:LacI family transcriptional regulator